MKITPTETDRLAAQLFAPAGGMRAAWRGERNGVRPVWERLRDGGGAFVGPLAETRGAALVAAKRALAEGRR